MVVLTMKEARELYDPEVIAAREKEAERQKESKKAALALASWEQFFQYFQFSEVSWLAGEFFVRASESDVVEKNELYMIAQAWLKHRWGDENRGLDTYDLREGCVDKAMKASGFGATSQYDFQQVVCFCFHYQEEHIAQEKSAGFTRRDARDFFDVFKRHEHNNQGLKARELWAILKDLGFEFPTQEEQEWVVDLVKSQDRDKSGSIDFDEFLQLVRKLVDRDRVPARKREHALITRSGMSLGECEEWLPVFQANDEGMGYVEIPKMRELFETINLKWDVAGSKVMMQWIHEVDEDNNGQVDFGEFCCLVQKMWDKDFGGIRSCCSDTLRKAEMAAKEKAMQEEAPQEKAPDWDAANEPTSPPPVAGRRKGKTVRRSSWTALLTEKPEYDPSAPVSPSGKDMVQKFDSALTHD
eukprot:gnl/TRDRNA2_/TRDRNA2_35364_c0_seq1.p1 gnl/TRDRNA2_/TRDRNA2_35364_c0~~gnl/TRDRNA2_/TRDRNA2_35364_c0_seq1.p1  ORF type:complete len:413 (+),score=105.18 gnl/TRDRNA2_/TRDRNA2_35364_c0_seq1:118-1356(+)